MKQISLLVLFLYLSLSNVFAELYIRYNQKGYHLIQRKEIIILSTTNATNEKWTIKQNDQLILEGTLGNSIAGKGDYVPTDFSYLIDFSSIQTEGTYTFEIKGQNVKINIKDYVYQDLAKEVLRTFRVRRSGSTDALDHQISHTKDNSCKVYERNGTDNTKWVKSSTIADVDMLGGWYDAGDYIKFTLTTAYSAYFLLKSHETAPEIFTLKKMSKTTYTDLLDEAKHGLDFLMKTFPNDNTFIIQVGGYQDHEVGSRLPENDQLDGYREAYHSFSKTHMGYTAAALALGAKQFKTVDSTLSNQYKEQAIAIFTKAETNGTVDYAYFKGNDQSAYIPRTGGKIMMPPPTPNSGGTGYATFYADKGANDNMALAAMELYKLTNDESYLTKAKKYATSAGAAYWNSWADANMTVHNMLVDKHTQSENYLKTDLNTFKNKAYATNNIWHTPHETTWGSLYSYIEVANSIAEYHITKKDETYFPIFLDVVDYVLGKNNWGISMMASKTMPYTADKNYAMIYKEQKTFPIGEVCAGPTTLQAMKDNGFSATNSPEAAFNTNKGSFFNDEKNYVTMESTICGNADALYLFTLASKIFSTTPFLSTKEQNVQKSINIYPNPAVDSFHVNLPENGSGTLSICDITGKVVYRTYFENVNAVFIKNDLKKGNYLVKVVLNKTAFTEHLMIK